MSLRSRLALVMLRDFERHEAPVHNPSALLQSVDTDNHSWANYFMCAYKASRRGEAADCWHGSSMHMFELALCIP